MILRPDYIEAVKPFMDAPLVKILTGVRRCGKSTVLKMIMEKLQQEHGVPSERIVSMRFDSMDYEDMTAKDMFKAVKEKLNPTGRTYLFLDEIQEIEGWEKVVNSLATDYDVDLYVTGSNSRMMSSEIATYLTGRYVSFRIYTLSFQEYLEFKKQYTQVKDIHAELADYIELPCIAKEYRKRAESMKTAIQQTCFGGYRLKDGRQQKLLQDGPGMEEYSVHCQAFAVLTGMVTPKEGKEDVAVYGWEIKEF